jgi:hypothetical protein
MTAIDFLFYCYNIFRMNSTHLILLLCLAATVSALATQHGLSQPSGYPSHDLFVKIESPCDEDEEVVSNGTPATFNGCGSAEWQVKALKMFTPYLQTLTPCCNQHDICFGTCALSNFA